MTSQNTLGTIRSYLKAIADRHDSGYATEHSYRPDLQSLIETLGGDGMKAINEPSHVECGAPDFIVELNGTPIGHLECKNVGTDLHNVEQSEQLKRYREGLPNLILTDYLEFRWYVEGTLRQSARIGSLSGSGKFTVDNQGASQFAELLSAFFNADVSSINNPRDLAKRMAAKARLLNDGITKILDKEGDTGPLFDLLMAYQEVLISDLSPTDFADLQAQTAAYGMFAARCRHQAGSGSFTRQSAVFAETTPLLQDVFGRLAGPGADQRIAWILDDLARLLDRADMSAILKDFGSRTAKEDPVVHFYEDFLAAYDPLLREMRGVYYTPEPVVSYIVRSVDILLRNQFGLTDGLADTEKVKMDVPGDSDEEIPKVLILDPAVGTGTFLREVVAIIHETVKQKDLGGLWPDYVRDHLLPRLFGFELLMAPYAVSHLKLALEIAGTEVGDLTPYGRRLNVFLTNTLEEPHDTLSPQFAQLANAIAKESANADAVKRDKPVMVVLGNPPYSGHSANKGQWISELLRGKDGEETTNSYFHVDGAPLGERNPKWLNDDYVKFIRYAQRRIERTGEGVLGFVTNHSYLDNPTFRGMRQSLMDTFNEIYLLDLHGNSKKKERTPEGGKDENVFDIQQGVAIGLFVKRADGAHDPALVFHADLWGKRDDGLEGGKYGWLAASDVESTEWRELHPKSPRYLFIPRDETLAEEYGAGWGMAEVFPINSVGVVTARDKLAIQWSSNEMKQVASTFAQLSEDDARNHFGLGSDAQGWRVQWAQEDIQKHSNAVKFVKQILYRPFDTRYTYYTGEASGFICRPREKVMRHMLAGPNVGIVTTRQCRQDWSAIASSVIIGHKALASYDINSLFPLYTYPPEEQKQLGMVREPNLSVEFIEDAVSSVGLTFITSGSGDLQESFGPEDAFHYIYAVLYSAEYRKRYADFLKSDFPRVPLTSNRSLFEALVGLGERLKSLHLMESEGSKAPGFPKEGNNRVDKVSYAPPTDTTPGRVFINGDQHFAGIAPETWAFTIGGYRPAEKWLKDRVRRTLSYDDIIHYRRICAVLAETPQVIALIDKTIDLHGGWPLQ